MPADGENRQRRLTTDPTFRALVLVAGVATLAALVILFVWEDAPFALTFDDAYYYFGIARNVAQGKGSTFDGINLTNGYHPLWLLVSAVPFAMGMDDLAAARALLAFQLLVGWGTALVLVAGLLARETDGWSAVSRREEDDTIRVRRAATSTLAITFLLIAVNPFIIKVFVNGLETGLLVPLLAALLLVTTRRDRSLLDDGRTGLRLGTSVLLALAFLARTDAILLTGCLGLWCLAEVWRASDGRGRAVLGMVQLFALPAVTIIVYLLVNNSMFGTPVQVSGLVKRAELGVRSIGLFAVFLAAAAYAGARGFQAAHRSKRSSRGRHGRRRRSSSGRFPLVSSFAARSAWFGAYCILVVGYYVALQTQIWLWYFAPCVLYGVIMLLLAVADMTLFALHQARPGRGDLRQVRPVQAIFFSVLGAALVFQIVAFREPHVLSIQKADKAMGEWLRDNTGTEDVIASWDAGAVGYFSHRPVVNIDGLVNSYEFYDALRRRKAGEHLRCQHVTHVANHGGDVAAEDGSFRRLITAMYGSDTADASTVVYDQSFQYSGQTTGSAGTATGLRTMHALVYEIPRERVVEMVC